MNDWKWPPRYTTMYYLSLVLLVASLPLSKFTMSLCQFSTLFFWLWHCVDTGFLKKYPSKSLFIPIRLFRFLGEVLREVFIALIKKFIGFFGNKPAMAIASLLLLHVIGLIYTTDFNYALKDLRTKLPIFIMPLFIATGPRISTRVFYWILAGFVAAVVGGSIYRLILYLNLPIADNRALDAHTSHIRYSLNAVYAIFCMLFFVHSKAIIGLWSKIFLIIASLWIAGFILFMNYTTGMALLLIISMLMFFFFIFRIKSIFWKISLLLAGFVAILLPAVWVINISINFSHKPSIDFSSLEKYSPRGNSYYHDTVNFKTKNGEWLGLYICDKELRQTWALRSSQPLDSLDPKGQTRRFTLIKYLASKGLRKDADGVARLTTPDIRNIEAGINSSSYSKWKGLQTQFEEFLISYQRYVQQNDPNSSSMMQRFEYWRTSLIIIRQNLVFGVGTGDVPDAFKKQYLVMNSVLSHQNRLRSHNQYLSITVAFGILGFIWFLFVMFYPGFKKQMFNNYFYIIFWIIFMVSMLTEDTIESQEGVTFYVLFTALLLLGREKPEEQEKLFG